MLRRSQKEITDVPTWFCTCESFQILLSTIEINFGGNDFVGLKCLHCQLFEDIVDIVSVNLK